MQTRAQLKKKEEAKKHSTFAMVLEITPFASTSTSGTIAETTAECEVLAPKSNSFLNRIMNRKPKKTENVSAPPPPPPVPLGNEPAANEPKKSIVANALINIGWTAWYLIQRLPSILGSISGIYTIYQIYKGFYETKTESEYFEILLKRKV